MIFSGVHNKKQMKKKKLNKYLHLAQYFMQFK